MRRAVMGLGMLLFAAAVGAGAAPDSGEPPWHLNAEYIEACSCNLFCACYFNPSPDKDYGNFNNALRVKRGNYGDVKLDGMKIWLSGNLGANFGSGDVDRGDTLTSLLQPLAKLAGHISLAAAVDAADADQCGAVRQHRPTRVQNQLHCLREFPHFRASQSSARSCWEMALSMPSSRARICWSFPSISWMARELRTLTS